MRIVRFVTLFSFFAVCLLAIPLATSARPTAPAQGVAPVTTIIVDSAGDPDNSKSKECEEGMPCTLRRAIVEARGLLPSERPVLIQFNIDKSDQGYESDLGIWRIKVLAGTDTAVFRSLDGGQITIDGRTQPDGRAQGPKIIIEGPNTGNKDGLLVGANNAGSHDGNTIVGLAFMNFKNHVIVNSNDNVISDNWFGLTADGTEPYLRNGDAQDGSGSSGVALSANVMGNEIVDNVFLGFDGVAAAIRGDGNSFAANYIGTDAEGNVPGKQTDPDLICTKVDWLGGGGISLEGKGHLISKNIFAGLRQQVSTTSIQPDAIRAAGDEHRIEDNLIGMDFSGDEVGVCGRGIYIISEPQNDLVDDNWIVNPGLSGISLNGALYDANELRHNVIKQRSAWLQIEGNPAAEDAIQLGKTLPDSLLQFKPAAVTKIDGKTVSGTSGAGSPCPNCVVELFLDDDDGIIEALKSLAVVTADDDGNWQATLQDELGEDQGLRTTSTSAKFNTIKGLSAGTTTGLSSLYVQEKPGVYLPAVLGE